MDIIKYGGQGNTCYFYNGRDMYDINTKKTVDIEPMKINMGDMVYYFKTSEYQKRFEKVYNKSDSEEIKSRKIFTVFNLIMKDKLLKYISWEKLQDIIFFDSKNLFLHIHSNDMDKEIEKGVDFLSKYYNEIFTSPISINYNEIYVICKVDHETGNHYYIYERIQNIIERTRKDMDIRDVEFTKTYWKLKKNYISKKSGKKIFINLSQM